MSKKKPPPEPVSIIEVDDNYLIHCAGLIDCYQQGVDLNYESFAMTSALPSLIAHIRAHAAGGRDDPRIPRHTVDDHVAKRAF